MHLINFLLTSPEATINYFRQAFSVLYYVLAKVRHSIVNIQGKITKKMCTS